MCQCVMCKNEKLFIFSMILNTAVSHVLESVQENEENANNSRRKQQNRGQKVYKCG